MMIKTFTEIRKARGLTIEALAQLAGSTHASIHAYESGKNIPRFDTAIKIAEVLGITVEDLAQSLDIIKIKVPPIKAAKTHRCHAIGCQREISTKEIMCPEHWQIVPQGLRQSIKQRLGKTVTPTLESAIDKAIIIVAQATVI